MRRSLAVVLGGILLVCLLVPSVASAEERGDPSGTYLGTVTGSSGQTFEAWAQLGRSRFGYVTVTVKVGDKPSFPIPIHPNWTSANSFTVSPSVYVPLLVDGSGSATWTQEGNAWTVAGQGTGSVMDGPEGSGQGQGVRATSDYIEPSLRADPINDTGGGNAAGGTGASGGTNVQPAADAAADALVKAGAMEQSPQVSDGGTAEAGVSSAAAVIAGILLCIFLGASMSGSEFADLWTAPEGSES